MSTTNPTTCRFSGKRFVRAFGGPRKCSDALDALLGLTVPLSTVEKWAERDRVPASVLAACVAHGAPVKVEDLVVCA